MFARKQKDSERRSEREKGERRNERKERGEKGENGGKEGKGGMQWGRIKKICDTCRRRTKNVERGNAKDGDGPK